MPWRKQNAQKLLSLSSPLGFTIGTARAHGHKSSPSTFICWINNEETLKEITYKYQSIELKLLLIMESMLFGIAVREVALREVVVVEVNVVEVAVEK